MLRTICSTFFCSINSSSGRWLACRGSEDESGLDSNAPHWKLTDLLSHRSVERNFQAQFLLSLRILYQARVELFYAL